MNSAPPPTKAHRVGTILRDAQNLTRALRRNEKHKTEKIRGYQSISETLWVNFDVRTRKQRAFQSMVARKAIYLFQLKLVDIAKLGRIAYRTVQYFLHQPSKVGWRSAGRIITATKILMIRRIMWFGWTEKEVWDRWHSFDHRAAPRDFRSM